MKRAPRCTEFQVLPAVFLAGQTKWFCPWARGSPPLSYKGSPVCDEWFVLVFVFSWLVYNVFWCGSLCVHLSWNLLSYLDVSFIKFGRFPAIISAILFIPVSSFWASHYASVGTLNSGSMSLRLCSFFFSILSTFWVGYSQLTYLQVCFFFFLFFFFYCLLKVAFSF